MKPKGKKERDPEETSGKNPEGNRNLTERTTMNHSRNNH